MLRLVFLASSIYLIVGNCYSQHDFDSLYSKSAEFKKAFKAISDTTNFFGTNKILEIILESDFKTLARKKAAREYQDAVITTMFNDTVMVRRKVEIKPRGNFRLQNCSYPPLTLNLPKKKAKLEQFQKFDKMKVVVDCQGSGLYEQYILSEFLAYKLYNILTEYSFMVRLAQIKYVDTSGKNKPRTRYAFFIESLDEMLSRLDAFEVERKNIHPEATDLKMANLMAVFQYMIGNTDWSIPGLHNLKLIKRKDPMIYVPTAVPYDFDYSGIVNATYAIPSDVLPIKSVRERLFRGYCRTPEEFEETFEIFRSKKDDLYKIYQENSLLSSSNIKYALSYLDKFYDTINDRKSVKYEFLEKCRK